MAGSDRHRISEPKLIPLALGAAMVMVIAIIATGDVWFAVLTVVAIALTGLAIVADMRGVAALRRAGIDAAGPVGDRDPSHAIHDALDLFPAADVVVVAQAAEIDLYREHVDRDELQRRTGADIQVLEAAPLGP